MRVGETGRDRGAQLEHHLSPFVISQLRDQTTSTSAIVTHCPELNITQYMGADSLFNLASRTTPAPLLSTLKEPTSLSESESVGIPGQQN